MSSTFAVILTAASGWEFWPFDQVYPSGFWPFVAKIAFVAVIFGAVILYLRKLFGPGGRMRPEGLETIQEAKAREAREAQERQEARQGSRPDSRPGDQQLDSATQDPAREHSQGHAQEQSDARRR